MEGNASDQHVSLTTERTGCMGDSGYEAEYDIVHYYAGFGTYDKYLYSIIYVVSVSDVLVYILLVDKIFVGSFVACGFCVVIPSAIAVLFCRNFIRSTVDRYYVVLTDREFRLCDRHSHSTLVVGLWEIGEVVPNSYLGIILVLKRSVDLDSYFKFCQFFHQDRQLILPPWIFSKQASEFCALLETYKRRLE
jgi:hypothetical protein